MKYPIHPPVDHFQLSTVLHALGDPTRLRIFQDLARDREKCCGDFDIPESKSTLTHHLKVLREAGITRMRIEGTRRFISLRLHDLVARFPGLVPAILNVPRRTPSTYNGK